MVKKSVSDTGDLHKAMKAWRLFVEVFGSLPLDFTKQNARTITSQLDAVLASSKAGMDEPLAMFLMDWISEFERQHVHLEDASPAEILRHLMEVNGLRQADLADEVGGQSVVSAILTGKREINPGQALRLGRRFKVSAVVFIGEKPRPQVMRPIGASIGQFKVSGSNLSQQAVATANATYLTHGH